MLPKCFVNKGMYNLNWLEMIEVSCNAMVGNAFTNKER